MGQLAVVAFPQAVDLSTIESFRQRFDPQASLIRAHVTVVFPFEPSREVPLHQHLVATVTDFTPIQVRLEPDAHADGNYLMMKATRGKSELVRLHARLHTGPLAPHLSSQHVYRPHLTLGRVADPLERDRALRQMRKEIATVDVLLQELAVFDLERRTVAFTVPLPT
jgi:2'-5' RNA ligase